METALILRGRLSDPRHIELDEAVPGLGGSEVEVVLRPIPRAAPEQSCDVFALIAQLPPGTRSKEVIDRQLAVERSAWGDR